MAKVSGFKDFWRPSSGLLPRIACYWPWFYRPLPAGEQTQFILVILTFWKFFLPFKQNAPDLTVMKTIIWHRWLVLNT
jgi:hypothetical protein